MIQYIIYSDGGSRGNPGKAGYGFLIKLKTKNEKLKTIVKGSKYIGIVTNNQAEYQGISAALKKMAEIFAKKPPKDQYKIVCRLDSQLIVEQMNGRYKIKNEGLKPLYWEIRELIIKLENRVVFEHIVREYNKEADELVNKAIDHAALKLRVASQGVK